MANAPWNANPEWAQHSLTVDKAAQLENEGWMNSQDVSWPGGSPTNYAKMNEHSNGTYNDVTMYHGSADTTTLREIFGENLSAWQGEDGYLYTIRNQENGRARPAKLDEVLQLIGRSYGQTGA